MTARFHQQPHTRQNPIRKSGYRKPGKYDAGQGKKKNNSNVHRIARNISQDPGGGAKRRTAEDDWFQKSLDEQEKESERFEREKPEEQKRLEKKWQKNYEQIEHLNRQEYRTRTIAKSYGPNKSVPGGYGLTPQALKNLSKISKERYKLTKECGEITKELSSNYPTSHIVT